MRGLGLTWAERKKAAQELKTHAAERAHDHANELAKLLNDAAMRDAQGAIRVLLAINGGAAAALLAFTAGLMGRSSSQISTVPLSSIAAVVANLKWFGWGVICSAVAAVLAYLTNVSIATAAGVRPRSWQYPYVHASRPAKTWLLAGRIFQVLGMSAGIAALVFFVYGLYKVQQRVGIIFAGT
jgi:hypothetical protein